MRAGDPSRACISRGVARPNASPFLRVEGWPMATHCLITGGTTMAKRKGTRKGGKGY